jgi:hypothetical protein
LPSSKIETEAEVLSISKTSDVDWKAIIQVDTQTEIVFNTHYFPGWYATVDGVDADINPTEPLGKIAVRVSPGEHEVRFFWKETPLLKFADYVSVASLLGVTFLIFAKRINPDLFERS